MKIGESFLLLSHAINFGIFIYFVVFLLKINALDPIGLSISAFGLFISLVSNIISVIEEKNS